jgi:hypothetical protein
MAGGEEGEIGQGVADIGEVVAELFAEGGQLILSGEVDISVGGEDAGEEAEMVRDAMGEDGVGGCGEVDRATGRLFLLEELEHLAVVGKVGDVELDGCGEVAFEGRFALGEPAGKLKKRCRFVTGEGQGRVDERVGFDECAIEVDTERRHGSWGELVDGEQRARQRSSPSFGYKVLVKLQDTWVQVDELGK